MTIEQTLLKSSDNEEAERLRELYDLRILDTPPEQAFDDLTSLARYIADTPFALISLLDRDRQWFKSVQGLSIQQTPRMCSFCAHTLNQPDMPLMVPDAQVDQRFADNPMVTDAPHIRFYLGIPLVTASHHVLGTLCVLDQRPRYLNPEVTDALCMLARQVMSQLELRHYHQVVQQKTLHEQERYLSKLEAYQRRLEDANHQLATACLIDRLTGIGNRAALEDWLIELVQRAKRQQQHLALLLIDVDHFKHFNGVHGHLAGDELLRELAHVLEGLGRRSDKLARYGGESFVMILPQTDIHEAWIVAERVRRTIERHIFNAGSITVSIGIANLKAQMEDEHALLLAADQALYAAKAQRRNMCVHRDEILS